MKKTFLRLSAVLLAILLGCAPLAACTINRDPLAVTAFASLTIDKKERVNATVTLTLPEAEAHEGERAYLYELLPGESIADVSGKAPLDNARVSTEMKFRFKLKDGERTRLYSSFAVCYSDGTPILSTPRTIDNPEILAGDNRVPLWQKNPKGLNVTDADVAASLGTAHALVSVDLSMLAADGDVSFRFCGKEYRLSSFILEVLDAQIGASYDAGLQVTLSINAGHNALTPDLRAALLDYLAARYATDERGVISVFFIEAEGLTTAETVELTSVAHKALLSRVSDGRVYVVCPERETLAAQAFFKELSALLDASSDLSWGAAVSPDMSVDPFKSHAPSPLLTPDELPALRNALMKTAGGPAYFAVCDLLIPATNEDRQTALFAYAYAQAVSANADLIFYASQKSDAFGLYTNDGRARSICELYKTIDTSPSRDVRVICRTVSEKALASLDSLSSSRRVLGGIGNTGGGSGKSETLFSFSNDSVNGFTAVGSPTGYAGQSNPKTYQSSTYNSPSLYATLNGDKPETGVRRILHDGGELEGVISLSFHALAQYAHSEAKTATMTLRLQGVDDHGEAIWLEASVDTSVRQWQSVTFNISDFTETADLSRPVVMTLLVSPDVAAEVDSEKEFGLWVRSATANHPTPDYSLFFIILLTVGGVGVSFLLVFSLYLLSRRSRSLVGRARK